MMHIIENLKKQEFQIAKDREELGSKIKAIGHQGARSSEELLL